MASKEYKQMIQRGKWLEKFLNPKLKSWGYKELALEFIDVYQVYFEFSKNDKFIEFLVEMEKKSEYYKCDGIISYNFDVRIQKVLLIKQQINHVFQAIISLKEKLIINGRGTLRTASGLIRCCLMYTIVMVHLQLTAAKLTETPGSCPAQTG